MSGKSPVIIIASIVMAISSIAFAQGFSENQCSLADNQFDSIAQFVHEGDLASFYGDYEMAIVSYSCALEIEAGYADAYLGRAMVYQAQGEHEMAIADFLMTLDYSGHEVDPHLYDLIAHSYEAIEAISDADYYAVLYHASTGDNN